MTKGKLCDHSDCYREICHVERERDDLRLELAQALAEATLLRARLAKAEKDLALEASW